MDRRKILVLDPFKEAQMVRIEKAAGDEFEVVRLYLESDKADYEEILVENLKKAEIVIGQPDIRFLQNVKVDCPNLRLIQISWAGTDHYTRGDLPFPSGITLCNGSGAYGMIISQFVVGLILSSMLGFKEYHNRQRKKQWERRGPVKSLDGARVLIYGAGNIGMVTAKRLKGFDAYITGVCRDVAKSRDYFDELCTLDEAEKYLPDADVVVCCLPNTSDTEGYMNMRRLELMKEDSVIVNVGRGNFIDCMALDDILRRGRIWGAALDVTNPEPLPMDHPLWDNPRCIITPHASGASFGHLEETEALICDIVCENIERYRGGKALTNVVL